jgi:hypothetical protein
MNEKEQIQRSLEALEIELTRVINLSELIPQPQEEGEDIKTLITKIIALTIKLQSYYE